MNPSRCIYLTNLIKFHVQFATIPSEGLTDNFFSKAAFFFIYAIRSIMMADVAVEQLLHCNVHVALMGSAFDDEGKIY